MGKIKKHLERKLARRKFAKLKGFQEQQISRQPIIARLVPQVDPIRW